MLVICDFDGTVTERDTNSALAAQFAPNAVENVAERLASRELTVREVLAKQFDGLQVPLEELIEAALQIPVRSSFTRLLDAAELYGAEVIVLSSGFRALIQPILLQNGWADRVPLVANDLIQLDSNAQISITWRQQSLCELCGEHCKREDVERLSGGVERTVFVGDGYSDRCGANVANRIFARDSLAKSLTASGVSWEQWNDFDDVVEALGWSE